MFFSTSGGVAKCFAGANEMCPCMELLGVSAIKAHS